MQPAHPYVQFSPCSQDALPVFQPTLLNGTTPDSLDYRVRQNACRIAELQSLLEESHKEMRRLQKINGKTRIKKVEPEMKHPISVLFARGPWTTDEKRLFEEAWILHGAKRSWQRMSSFIGSRSPSQVRKYARENAAGYEKHMPPPSMSSSAKVQAQAANFQAVKHLTSSAFDPNSPTSSESTDPASPLMSRPLRENQDWPKCQAFTSTKPEVPIVEPNFLDGPQDSFGMENEATASFSTADEYDWDGSFWDPACTCDDSATADFEIPDDHEEGFGSLDGVRFPQTL